jgi:hypothetical protein
MKQDNSHTHKKGVRETGTRLREELRETYQLSAVERNSLKK